MAEKKWVKVNLNDKVRVKLTDVGLAMMKENHDRLNRLAKGMLGEFIPPVVDSEGYSALQLWCVAHELGSGMYNGANVPCETEILIELSNGE